MYNAKIKWCHVCDQGWVSIVKTNENYHYCLCEECETEWDTPKDCLNKVEGTHFKYSSAVELSDEDIEKNKWKQFIIL